ncbi:MAG: 5'-3' exonuclease, partial [Lachnospiraceae bacterium]
MEEKLLLVDGHSLLFRAFYGMPLSMTAPDGVHTNAVYGFLAIFRKVLEEEQPSFVAVAFDTKEKTFRHDMYPEYKGTRKPAPPEFHEQLPLIKEVLDAMGVRVVTLPGFEADDILGTLARRAEKEGVAPRILSGDRDLLQIATEKTQIILPKTKGGETVYERYFAADVLREMGVTPEAFVDMKALMGDSSDNIPGLPGVGPKTASAIIAKYGSIENAKLHEAEITPKKARQAMEEHYDLAELSKELAKICTDAPLAVAVRDLTPGDMKSDAVREVYRRLGFRSFLSEFAEKAEEKKGTEIRVVNDVTAAEETFAKAEAAGKVGLSVVAGKKEVYAVGLAFGEEAVALVPEGFLTEEYLCEKLSVLTGKIEQIASMNIKEILK